MTFTHPLDTVGGSQVLDQCFRFLGCFSRNVGLLPITITSTGYTEACLLSRHVISTVLYIVAYIGLSFVYLPLYLKSVNNLKQKGMVVYVSENLFFGGQVFGVGVTVLLIPHIARSFTRVWNEFVPVVEFCVEQGYKERFKSPYKRSRISMVIFMLTGVMYGIICWRTFAAGIELQSVTGTIMYYVHAVGFIAYFLLTCCHFVYGFVMLFFVFTFKHCFLMLKEVIERDMVGGEVCKGMDRPNMEEHFKVYKALVRLCELNGMTFGLYLVSELVVMVTSVLMNAFTMLSGFEQRDALSTTLSFVAYFGWLIVLTEGGERFRLAAYHCSQSLKDSVYLHSTDPSMLHKVSQLEVPKFSAMGYFTVDRRLAVTVGSTFATYLVVIIQFKLNVLTSSCPQE